MGNDRLLHTATVEVAVPAEEAFAFLADISNTPKWITGVMLDWEQLGERFASGRSLLHGSRQYVALYPEPELLWMPMTAGGDPDDMLPAGAIRVLRGADTKRAPDSCLVTMMVWHIAGPGLSPKWVSEQWWEMVGPNLHMQVEMIKGHLEGGF